MLVTVNNRLARELRQQHDQQQATQATVWQSAMILPWSAWLQQNYMALVDQGLVTQVLLQEMQEMLIWQRIVQQDAEAWLRPQAAASLAQQAWRLWLGWQLDVDALETQITPETACFVRWQQAFRQECATHGWITAAELPDLFTQHAAALTLPARITFAGFDQFSPQQQTLLDQLQAQGIVLETLPDTTCQAQVQAIRLDCPRDEIRAAAIWAKQYIQQDPTLRIAVITPQLQAQRAALLQGFGEILSPATMLPGGVGGLPFNLALGCPLADCPLVAQLLLVLQLTRPQPLPLAEISVVLRSPFIGEPDEWLARAALDRRLYQDDQPQLNLMQLIRRARTLATQDDACHVSDLTARLARLQQQVARQPRLATPTARAEQLSQLIQILGWPGHGLNSTEYQQAARLRRLLSELASLELVQAQMTWSETLNIWHQLCSRTIFQAESTAHQLHILGPLEASGLQFDAVWLLGMDALNWPPAARPHPLLPTSLQCERAMPHASGVQELAFAQRLTDYWCQMAPTVMVSYAAQIADQPRDISPLFAAASPATLESMGLTLISELHQAASQTTELTALPWPEAVPPGQTPRGGTHLLNAQAACPFQAVARFRLGAQAWPSVSFTPDARLRGQLLHQLLYEVWVELQDSDRLQSMSDAGLQALLTRCAEQVLKTAAVQRPDLFHPAFVALETERLVKLIHTWLELEKQRTTPFQVRHLEERRPLTLHGLDLQVQADRVDELADGEQVVIDYKSGLLNQPDWAAERPGEWQVPLYCLQAEKPVAALLGQVHGQSTRFRGMATYADIAPGIPALQPSDTVTDWPDLIRHWRQVLAQLTTEIQSGHAEIAPRNAQTCTHCGLQALCRVEANV